MHALLSSAKAFTSNSSELARRLDGRGFATKGNLWGEENNTGPQEMVLVSVREDGVEYCHRNGNGVNGECYYSMKCKDGSRVHIKQ